MGWDFVPGFTKTKLIKSITKDRDFVYDGIRYQRKCIAKTEVKEYDVNVLWTVWEENSNHVNTPYEITNSRYIMCSLLKRGCGGYGSKDIQEYEGPGYYSCPLEYLDMVIPPEGGYSEWRGKVREWHG